MAPDEGTIKEKHLEFCNESPTPVFCARFMADKQVGAVVCAMCKEGFRAGYWTKWQESRKHMDL